MVPARIVVSFVLGLVFAVAGVSKLRTQTFDERVDAVRTYGVPAGIDRLIARVFPWLEMLIAGALWSEIGTRVAAGCALTLLAAFTVAVAWHLTRGRRFSCGCAAGSKPIGWSLAARDALLSLGAAALVSNRARRRDQRERFGSQHARGWS